MPPLDNQRHEKFAQALAEGMSADAAYAEAGYKPDRGNASRLTSKDSIQARVYELQQAAAKKAVLTLSDHLETLKDIRDAAIAARQYAAATNAEVHRGKAAGLYVERIETSDVVRVVSAEPMTDDEWEQQYGAQTSEATH